MKMKMKLKLIVAGSISLWVGIAEADVVTNVWTGTAAADWDTDAVWSLGRKPQTGECVILEAASTQTMTLSHETPALEELIIRSCRTNKSSAYRTRLTVSGWDSCIRANKVYLDLSGEITTSGCFADAGPSNRVYVVAGDMTMDIGAKIDLDKKGYGAHNGPGWQGVTAYTQHAGGAYGGYSVFAAGTTEDRPHAYGVPEAPEQPGTGNYAAYKTDGSGAGGGAVRLDLSGDFVLNGVITANGQLTTSGGASGGGIYVTCRTISGSGTMRANGGRNGDETANPAGAAGGGGRVAVIYDIVAQNGVNCNVRFEARGGNAYGWLDRNFFSDTTGRLKEWVATPGSLYFSDSRFLTDMNYLTGGYRFAGVWCAPDAPGELTFSDDLVMDNCQLSLPSVTNFSAKGLTLVGNSIWRTDNGLSFPSAATVKVDGDLLLKGARLEMRGGTLDVAGDLVLSTNLLNTYVGCGGALSVYADPTNRPNAVGAQIAVAGTLTIGALSTYYPYCDETNGSIVVCHVGNLVVEKDGLICADLAGYAPKRGTNPNYGPGLTGYGYKGATYGGRGGAQTESVYNGVSSPYGSASNPLDPGTGGYTAQTYWGYNGGGVVRIVADHLMTIDGLVSACGNMTHFLQYSTGSSGGAVFLEARRLAGDGEIAADGGYGDKDIQVTTNEGAGGGGRIAIYCNANVSSTIKAGSPSAHASAGLVKTSSSGTVSSEGPATFPAEDGTVFFGNLKGGLVIILK